MNHNMSYGAPGFYQYSQEQLYQQQQQEQQQQMSPRFSNQLGSSSPFGCEPQLYPNPNASSMYPSGYNNTVQGWDGGYYNAMSVQQQQQAPYMMTPQAMPSPSPKSRQKLSGDSGSDLKHQQQQAYLYPSPQSKACVDQQQPFSPSFDPASMNNHPGGSGFHPEAESDSEERRKSDSSSNNNNCKNNDPSKAMVPSPNEAKTTTSTTPNSSVADNPGEQQQQQQPGDPEIAFKGEKNALEKLEEFTAASERMNQQSSSNRPPLNENKLKASGDDIKGDPSQESRSSLFHQHHQMQQHPMQQQNFGQQPPGGGSGGGGGVGQAMLGAGNPDCMQQQPMHGTAMQQFPFGYCSQAGPEENAQHLWGAYGGSGYGGMYGQQQQQQTHPSGNDPAREGFPNLAESMGYAAAAAMMGGPGMGQTATSWWPPMGGHAMVRSHSPPSRPDMGAAYRMPGGPTGARFEPAWALGRGGSRRGPGRPRIGKIGEEDTPPDGLSGAAITPPGVGQGGPSSPYPPPPQAFPGSVEMEMMPSPPTPGSRNKRGPGRPRTGLPPPGSTLLDPMIQASTSPPIPTTTTTSSSSTGGGGKSKGAASNKKRYTCEICQKRFSTAWYVRVHRRSHNGERPYICHNCGKGFMLPNVLQVHLRKCEKNANPNNTSGAGGARNSQQQEQQQQQQQQQPRSETQENQSPKPPYADHPMMMQPQHQQLQHPSLNPQNPFGLNGDETVYGSQRFAGYAPPFPGGQSEGLAGMGGSLHPHFSQHDPHQQHSGYDLSSPMHRNNLGLNQVDGMSPSASEHFPHHPSEHHPLSRPSPPSSHSSNNNHFLANDRPPDEGGGPVGCNNNDQKPVIPLGVDPDLYCLSCETQFDEKTQMDEHQKSVHRPYSCEVCEKRFSQKCNLMTHMRLHTGERPYSCSFCDKRFTQKGNLDAHLKTHTKEKPYPCPHCDKKFAFKSSMISHAKQAHSNLMVMSSSGISPLSLDFEDVSGDGDEIGVLKQQVRSHSNGSGHSLPGIPTPQSSLDSLSSAPPSNHNNNNGFAAAAAAVSTGYLSSGGGIGVPGHHSTMDYNGGYPDSHSLKPDNDEPKLEHPPEPRPTLAIS